ncbi:MAG: hypothetical protein AB1650_03475 [Candidatus Omnitrophota bacterium]
MKVKSFTYRLLSVLLSLTLTVSFNVPASAQNAGVPIGIAGLDLPAPGAMLSPGIAYNPPLMAGMTIYPDHQLKFDFLISTGDDNLQGDAFRDEAKKLINYFLASLTVPDQEMWVNLSPYEEDRIIARGLGTTEMGRDMLAQDYILKQLTASLMYPEEELGDRFWKRVYEKTRARFGTTEIPANTFNKVWIVPEKAVVYVNGAHIFVSEAHLKVMLEEDYLALEANNDSTQHGLGSLTKDRLDIISQDARSAIREIIIPAIEKEVNEGKNFANLRQIYYSIILAAWYKKNLRESLLGKAYMDKNKINGIDLKDTAVKEKIYARYIEAFKKGVYDYIKEDYDETTREVIPRKYFSGGADFEKTAVETGELLDSNSVAAQAEAGKVNMERVEAEIPLTGGTGEVVIQPEQTVPGNVKITVPGDEDKSGDQAMLSEKELQGELRIKIIPGEYTPHKFDQKTRVLLNNHSVDLSDKRTVEILSRLAGRAGFTQMTKEGKESFGIEDARAVILYDAAAHTIQIIGFIVNHRYFFQNKNIYGNNPFSENDVMEVGGMNDNIERVDISTTAPLIASDKSGGAFLSFELNDVPETSKKYGKEKFHIQLVQNGASQLGIKKLTILVNYLIDMADEKTIKTLSQLAQRTKSGLDASGIKGARLLLAFNRDGRSQILGFVVNSHYFFENINTFGNPFTVEDIARAAGIEHIKRIGISLAAPEVTGGWSNPSFSFELNDVPKAPEKSGSVSSPTGASTRHFKILYTSTLSRNNQPPLISTETGMFVAPPQVPFKQIYLQDTEGVKDFLRLLAQRAKENNISMPDDILDWQIPFLAEYVDPVFSDKTIPVALGVYERGAEEDKVAFVPLTDPRLVNAWLEALVQHSQKPTMQVLLPRPEGLRVQTKISKGFPLAKFSDPINDQITNGHPYEQGDVDVMIAQNPGGMGDQAMLSETGKEEAEGVEYDPAVPGGIDFNPAMLNLKENGRTGGFGFDNAIPGHIRIDAVQGAMPVIINITPVTDFLPLLGLVPEPEDRLSLL